MFQQGGYVESEQLEAEAQRGEIEKEGERKWKAERVEAQERHALSQGQL